MSHRSDTFRGIFLVILLSFHLREIEASHGGARMIGSRNRAVTPGMGSTLTDSILNHIGDTPLLKGHKPGARIVAVEPKVLHVLRFPYSTFERGPEKWVAHPAGDIPVPKAFWIAVDFNPGRTKGVYVGFEKTGAKSHSKVGTPVRGLRDWEPMADWMIRVDLAAGGEVTK